MPKKLLLLILLAVCVVAVPRSAAASDDSSGTFLVTITDASSGAFVSRSVITLHSDHSVAVIDSGQDGPVPFSSQLGVWDQAASGAVEARTIDFSFPFATQGSARVDYKFNGGISGNQVHGSIVLTFFPANGNPLDGGGTPGGTFNFSGTRVTVP
jgi:hypothetical protein